MIILSVNAGSSSLKFMGFKMPEEEVIVSGIFEKIGMKDSFYTIKVNDKKIRTVKYLPTHDEAVNTLLEELLNYKVINSYGELEAIGHRVVHGGEKYKESVVVDDNVEKVIRELSDLAPLHNPANLMGIETFKKILPNAKNVAVFDTAFHQTMKKEAYIYPVPYQWYTEYGIRKYGFHGTSHKYVYLKICEVLGRDDLKVISCHLGNGGSITAINSGKVVDTSLGFTPLAGLMMGTRSGDIDESIIPYVMKKSGKTLDQVMDGLNKESGLLGISGVSSDSRDVLEGVKLANERCILAEEMYERRVVNFIASYNVLLDGADVICFTAGIGENSIETRKGILEKLASLGIKIDEEANNVRGELRKITMEDSSVMVYVVPTNEELMIARDTYELV